jgi:hypothetical protein
MDYYEFILMMSYYTLPFTMLFALVVFIVMLLLKINKKTITIVTTILLLPLINIIIYLLYSLPEYIGIFITNTIERRIIPLFTK